MPYAVPLPSVLWGLCAILAILIVATISIATLSYRHPEKNYGELKLRIRSWWIIITLFSLAMVLSRTVALVFFAFISFLALKEYLSLIPTRRADRRVLFWAYATVPLQYIWIGMSWYGMFIIFIPVYVFLFLPMRMVTIGETKDFLRAVGTLHWGLMITVFSLSHTAYLMVLPESRNPLAGGAGLVLYLVFLTQFNDIAQYLWGKLLGRHKVIPKVSPNKTWEGLMGGVITTMVLAVALAPWLTPLTTMQSFAAGLIIGIGGFIGDVTISALKRDLGIKDTGAILPGHGGILDRVDSLIYTAPLFFHFMWYLHF